MAIKITNSKTGEKSIIYTQEEKNFFSEINPLIKKHNNSINKKELINELFKKEAAFENSLLDSKRNSTVSQKWEQYKNNPIYKLLVDEILEFNFMKITLTKPDKNGFCEIDLSSIDFKKLGYDE